MDNLEKTLEARGDKYGPFSGHARVTQRLKRIIHTELQNNLQYSALDPVIIHTIDEALDMIAHKIGRIVNGDPAYEDSWHDIQGYAKLAEDIIKNERARNGKN